MNDRWSARSIALHWASAALVAALVAAGFVMSDLPAGSALRLVLSRAHTLLGLALAALTAVRLVARFKGSRPAPLPLAPLHRRGVGVAHGLLYAAVFALAASGVATALGSAWPDYLRGARATAPDFEGIAAREAHERVAFALLALVALHVVGVLVQDVRKGGALRRMIPWLGPSRASE